MIFFSVSLYCLQRIGNFKLFIYQPYPKLFIIDSHLSTLANIIKSLKYYITQLSITQMFFRVYETHPSCQLPHPKVILSTQPYFYGKPRFIFSQIKIRFPSLDILQNHWKTLFYQHFNSSYSSTLDINATNSTWGELMELMLFVFARSRKHIHYVFGTIGRWEHIDS